MHDRGPLAGIRVVDLSTAVTGSQATQVLADFGAEVLHVEPPGGSPLRSLPSFPFLGRGKRSLVADLREPDDLAVVRASILGADIVVETFRPGVAERLGLDFEDLRRENPGLVWGSITGFGRTGPYADVKGYEALVMAKLGGMHASAGMVGRPGPAHVSAPWAGYGATQLLLIGMLSALHERGPSGRGQRVDTSLVAGVAAQGPYNWFLKLIADRYPDAFDFAPPFSPSGVPNDGVFFMLLIALTRDGRWMQFAQVQPHPFRALMAALDLEDMFDDPRWEGLPRLPTEELRSEFWDIMLAKVRERTFAEWQDVFEADHDVWAEIFRRGDELLDHPQIRHLGAAVVVDDPERGAVRQPGPLVMMEQTPAAIDGAVPVADADGPTMRRSPWERREAAAAPATPRGLALDGVTILELGSFYAAPYGATVLADLGARVIKVEPLEGEPIRWLLPFPEAGAIKVLQGKETIAVDISTPEGLEIVHELARRADLVLMSYRAGVAERQGIDPGTLRGINPDLVYLTCPGYGADGPCGDRPAYAPSIGAGSGLTMRNMGGIVPEHPDLSLGEIRDHARRIFGSGTGEYAQADGISALSVGTAMALGLVIRDLGGPGQHMVTSMLTSAQQMLCDDLTVWDGRPPTVAPDRELYGFGARYRLYETAEGWVYLAAPNEHEWPDLVAALAPHVDLGADPRFVDEVGRQAADGALADAIASAMTARTAAEWETHMRRHDVGLVEVETRTPETVLQSDDFGRASGFVVDVVHPVIDAHPRLAPLVTLGDSGGTAGAGTTVGQHTGAVLRELGYSDEQIAALRAAEVIGGR